MNSLAFLIKEKVDNVKKKQSQLLHSNLVCCESLFKKKKVGQFQKSLEKDNKKQKTSQGPSKRNISSSFKGLGHQEKSTSSLSK